MAIAIGIIQTVVGTGEGGDAHAGPATQALIGESYGCASDTAGNLYISDGRTHTLRRIDKDSGIITTVAGSGRQGYSGDGGPATAAHWITCTRSMWIPTGTSTSGTNRMPLSESRCRYRYHHHGGWDGDPGYSGDEAPVCWRSCGSRTIASWMAKAACSSRIFRISAYAVWTEDWHHHNFRRRPGRSAHRDEAGHPGLHHGCPSGPYGS